jgi:PAS domain S-box-containing protein
MELFILSDTRKKIDILTHERDDYREQVQRLEREVLHLKKELGEVGHKARRCRTVASLVCKLYGALQPQITIDEIGPVFLRLLTETLHIERAVLLIRSSEDNHFIVQHAVGFSVTADTLHLDGEYIRDFAFTNAQSTSDPFLAELEKFLGLPFFLWSYKKEEKTALLLGNSFEDDDSYPFEQDDQKVIESMLNVFIEIIVRKQTGKELRLAAEVFAGSVEGTIITDSEFRVLRVNPAFTQITGHQPDEVVGRKLSWLENEEFAQQVRNSLKKKDHWRGELRDVSKSGADYVSWLNISSVKNVQGKVTDYIVAFLDITQEKYRQEENDRFLEELNTAYRRFVPQRFLVYLGKPSVIDIELGNHVERSMTVLFSDIVDFTKLSESMSPTENFRFINSYLSVMEPVIAWHNGFIDKYIGDAIMALFDGKADDAVRAAVAMLRFLVTYNEGRVRAGYKSIDISIGVNTGTLMLGTVGSPMRMEGTVISDSVNVAARIEGVNKIYRTSLLIGEETYKALQNPDDFALRRIDQFKAKGKSKTVTIYEVFESDPAEVKEAKLESRHIFVSAVNLYHSGQFREASQLFNECIAKCGQDQVARYYIECCHRHLNIEETRW